MRNLRLQRQDATSIKQSAPKVPMSPRIRPRIMRDNARLLMTRRSPLEPLLYHKVNHQLGVAHSTAGVAPVGVNWGQSSQNGLQHVVAAVCMNSGSRGRWDRNRTCNLQFWSPGKPIQGLSGSVAGQVFRQSDVRRVSHSITLCRRFRRQLWGGRMSIHPASKPLK
jgi:hypothetical protein